MDDLISVIIPIYNVEKYLNRCVDSVVEQTYTNLEIILVDDGSPDNCGKMCDDYEKKDKRIKVIHKKNGGLSDARNVGLDNASGKYICFLDSDDFLSSEMIEKMICRIIKTEADVAICNRIHYFDSKHQKVKYQIVEKDIIMSNEEAIKELNSYRYFDMSACGKLYKKELFNEIRFPVGKLSEDAFVMYLLLDKSSKIIYFSEPLYYYYQRQNSISKSVKLNYDFIEAAENQVVFVEKKYPSLKKYVRAAYASANMTVYNIIIKNNGKCDKKEIEKLKENVRKNYKYILQCENWSKSKKIQAILFIKSIKLYNLIFRLYRLKNNYN